MSKQRESDDFCRHPALGENAKAESHLPILAHIRWNDRDKVAYYLKRRSEPSAGYEEGNFSLDRETLESLLTAQKRGRIKRAYVVLVERYTSTSAIACDTLMNVMARVSRVKPYEGTGGNEFWWVFDDLEPLGKIEYTEKAPF